MATIKAYTDLEQSKVLSQILPLDSADMYYNNASIKGINYVDEYRAELIDFNTAQKVLSKYLINPMFGVIPCWILAALLSMLPNNKLCYYDDRYYCQYMSKGDEFPIYSTMEYDNPVDACYEMILITRT